MDQVRNYSVAQVDRFCHAIIKFIEGPGLVRRDSGSCGKLYQSGTLRELSISYQYHFFRCELNIFELGAVLKCATDDSFEVFAADNAREGNAMRKRTLFNDFELIREGDTREGDAVLECSPSYIRNVAVFTEYHTHEMVTISERHLRNALKFGAASEVDSKEGAAIADGLVLVPPNCSEVETHQGEIDGAV